MKQQKLRMWIQDLINPVLYERDFLVYSALAFCAAGVLVFTQLTFTSSKATIETLEKGIKYVQS